MESWEFYKTTNAKPNCLCVCVFFFFYIIIKNYIWGPSLIQVFFDAQLAFLYFDICHTVNERPLKRTDLGPE